MICCTSRPIRACAVVNDMLSFVAFDLTAFYQANDRLRARVQELRKLIHLTQIQVEAT